MVTLQYMIGFHVGNNMLSCLQGAAYSGTPVKECLLPLKILCLSVQSELEDPEAHYGFTSKPIFPLGIRSERRS